MTRSRLKLFSDAALVVRGLLAEATGNPDRPYKAPALKLLATPRALELAASRNTRGAYPPGPERRERPPLFSEASAASDTFRAELAEAVNNYSAKYGVKPPMICVKDLGVFCARSCGDGSALDGRVAVVTGAAGAIGNGICAGLLRGGCKVAATDVNAAGLKSVKLKWRQLGLGGGMTAVMDVTNAGSVSNGFDRVARRWGGFDAVVINAGIAAVSFLMDMDLETFRRLIRVNVEGALLSLREAAKRLVRQGIGGDIILISTKNVAAPGAGFGAYSATKAAAHQLGRIASIEFADYDIRVNMVAPDAVFGDEEFPSGLWNEVGPQRMKAKGLSADGLRRHYRDRNLLKSEITPRHIAEAVIFFLTRSTPTTGATLPVDGGLPEAAPR